MSNSETYKDTGRTTAYYQGVTAERERIIKLLEGLAEHSELCESGCYVEDCSAFAYEYAIDQIKAGQK